MSGVHEYGLEVKIENPALRELLLKYKKAGAFDWIGAYCVGPYGHLLVADTIDGVDHDFCFSDTSSSRKSAGWAFPQNVYQLLPYIVTIISKTFCYPSATAAAFYFIRDDLMAHRDEIYRSYRSVTCRSYQADSEYGSGGSREEKRFEIDREGRVFHSEEKRRSDGENLCEMSVTTKDSCDMNYLLLPERSEKLRLLSQKAEAEAALWLRSIEYDFAYDKKQKRDVRDFHIWKESEEGKRELQKEREEARKHLAAELEKKGGDTCPIDILDLPKRPYDRLVRANILTIGDLKKLSYNDIRHVKNMGPASAESIKSALESFGIFLQ